MVASSASSAATGAVFFPRLQVGGQSFGLDKPTMLVATLLAVTVALSFAGSLLRNKHSDIPIANPPGPGETIEQKIAEFAKDAARILSEARVRFRGKPFVVLTPRGRWTILPPEKAQEVRNNPNLNFRKLMALAAKWMKGIGSTAALLDHPTEGVVKVINKHLTKRLNTVTGALAEEASFAVRKRAGDSSEWTEINIYSALLDVVARLSSRIFLGPEVCRNEEWLDITKTFAGVSNKAVKKMQGIPFILQPLVYFTDPGCRTARQQFYRARALMMPVIRRRRQESHEHAAKGIPAPVYNDAIEWAETEIPGTGHDPVDVQLLLSSVAIHTTSDLVCQTMLQLVKNPEYIPPLREEMVKVLAADGWKKTSLTNLRLLDSAIKEAQRLKPIHMTGMQRLVTADIELQGGIRVPKGDIISVDSSNMMNPAIFENPEKYDAFRFYEMRGRPGGEHVGALVSVSPQHLAFGYGKFACPGRFFAANEIKLILCHLLLKYDWELVPGTPTKPAAFGIDATVNPNTMMRCRRREEELDLDNLTVDSTE